MGTRADFYLGRGLEAKWVGSIGWDGYPDGLDEAVLTATDEVGFLKALKAFFKERDDVTDPKKHGWPWPWEDSNTTDYAYAFDENRVWINCFGHGWYSATGSAPAEEGDYYKTPSQTVFPLYGGRQPKLDLGDRSGLLVISAQLPKAVKSPKPKASTKRPKAE